MSFALARCAHCGAADTMTTETATGGALAEGDLRCRACNRITHVTPVVYGTFVSFQQMFGAASAPGSTRRP